MSMILCLNIQNCSFILDILCKYKIDNCDTQTQTRMQKEIYSWFLRRKNFFVFTLQVVDKCKTLGGGSGSYGYYVADMLNYKTESKKLIEVLATELSLFKHFTLSQKHLTILLLCRWITCLSDLTDHLTFFWRGIVRYFWSIDFILSDNYLCKR